MDRELVKTISDKDVLKKKEWIWILILLLGGTVIFFSLCMDMGKIEVGYFIDTICDARVKSVLWQASETICGAVITYSTMLVAIVVFFYSVIDNKRLGIPYRRLIAYTIGSHTIPILFMAILLLTIFMLIVRSVPWRYTTFACIIYILMIQIFVIIEILISTSYKHCKRIICRIERRRYIAGMGVEEEFNTEWAYSFGHLEHAIHSEEFIPDKKELLIDFLWIPFHRHIGRFYKKAKDGQKCIETERLERIYQFYFVNILSAFQNFDGDEKHLERNQLYICIKDFVLALSERNLKNMKDDINMQYVYHMALSGIMNGLISSNVEDGIVFCNLLFSKYLLNGDVSRRQLSLFALFLEMLSIFETKMIFGSVKWTDYADWKPFDMEDVVFCAEFWGIWTKMYDISFLDKVQHFERAMQTLSGRSNVSAVISGMLLTMKEKDEVREKDNGQRYINKNTTAEE